MLVDGSSDGHQRTSDKPPYAERGSPKFEKAAMRWRERYVVENKPKFKTFAQMTISLAEPDRMTAR